MITITTERQKLTDRLSSVSGRAQHLLNLADQESRDLTDEESTEFERLTKDVGKLKARLGSLELLNESEEFLNASVGRDTVRAGINLNGLQNNPHAAPRDLDLKRKPGTFANLFGSPPSRHSFRDLGDFVKAAVYGNDARLMNANMTEGSGPAGGYLVPMQYSQAILDQSLESEVIRPNANVIPMAGPTLDLPIFNTTDRTGAKRAGLQMVMIGEAATSTAQSAITSNLKLTARKGAVFVDVSGELEADVPGFSTYLGQQMASAIGGGFDYMFVQGTGAGQPLGIVNAPCTATVTKESGQSAGTVLANNLLKMAGRLHPACWARSVWLVSPSALSQLLSVSQEAGPSGGKRTVELVDRDGMILMMTRPVIITDACSAVGTKGDVILADLSQYVVGLRKELSLEREISSGWKDDLVGFRMITRFDGQPAWPSAVTPRAGSDTLSAFVTIETR